MLLKITQYCDLNERKLMDIYSESNYENTDYFYPNEDDKDLSVKKVEAGFLDFLKKDFFKLPKAVYWILEMDGDWVSALRTCFIQPDIFYLEALETRPDQREKGYGAQLLSEVVNALKGEGPFRIRDCVSKKNISSLKTHKKCGFQIISEEGYDYLHEEADQRDYGLEYKYQDEGNIIVTSVYR